jgi:hypothetical protein
MKETIFYLEGRGGRWMYHFFLYNLSSLYFIQKHIYNYRGRSRDSVLLDDTSKIVHNPSKEISYPIKIHMKDVIPFQKETFEIIKHHVELIEDLSSLSYDYEIVSIYGDTCEESIGDNRNATIPFLRNLFLERCHFPLIKGKRIYVTRKNSEPQHYGTLKRHMLNEDEFINNILNKYNIEYIQLEEHSMLDKIKLFMESELIISPHSGCLTLLMFSNINSKVIEILNKGTDGFSHVHHIDTCQILGIHYNRYSNIHEDNNGNFVVNMAEFEKYLVGLL